MNNGNSLTGPILFSAALLIFLILIKGCGEEDESKKIKKIDFNSKTIAIK